MTADSQGRDVGDGQQEPAAQSPPSGKSINTTTLTRTSGESRRSRENVTAFAAFISALGAIISALTTIVTLHFTDIQLGINDDSQVTSRYTAAVAELGASSTDVRLGGIYALSRLGHDSPPDRPTVINVLAAYARNHLPNARSPACAATTKASGSTAPRPILDTDVSAALQVLGGLNSEKSDARTTRNLARACLSRTTILENASFTGFDLTGANLNDAYLGFAVLDSASLRQADLRRAHLFSARLARSVLNSANLTGADLTEAADLTGADLTGANFSNANLSRAKLTGANLTGAVFTGANLIGTVGIDPSLARKQPRVIKRFHESLE